MDCAGRRRQFVDIGPSALDDHRLASAFGTMVGLDPGSDLALSPHASGHAEARLLMVAVSDLGRPLDRRRAGALAPVDMIYLPAVLAAAALWRTGAGAGRRDWRPLSLTISSSRRRSSPSASNRVTDIVTWSSCLSLRSSPAAGGRGPQPGANRRRSRGAQCDNCRLRQASAFVHHGAGYRADCVQGVALSFQMQCPPSQRSSPTVHRRRLPRGQSADAKRYCGSRVNDRNRRAGWPRHTAPATG